MKIAAPRTLQLLAPWLLVACASPPASVHEPARQNGQNQDTTMNANPDFGGSPSAYDAAQPAPYDGGVSPTYDGGTSGCGTAPMDGVCAGNIARYCDSGQIGEEDCAAEGAVCTSDSTGASCAPSGGGAPDLGTTPTQPTSSCGSVTSDGTCSGANTLEYCDDYGMLQTVDCSMYGGCIVESGGYADCANSSGA